MAEKPEQVCAHANGIFDNYLTQHVRYTTPQINTYPTVTNAITIVTTLIYGWTSDAIQLRSPIVYFSLVVCFFAAMNLAIWDGVPFGLKWASYYLTGCVDQLPIIVDILTLLVGQIRTGIWASVSGKECLLPAYPALYTDCWV